jgi:glucosamine--fructose-6-phosphate aminotransferase (isomerizing)
MFPTLRIVEGNYLSDLLNQPQALDDTFAGLQVSPALQRLLQRLRDGALQRIVLTGMGSSFYALHPLNLKLIEHGFTSVMAETSELIHYMPRLLAPGTLLIAVSQSGESAEIVRLLRMNRMGSAILGLTNTPNSQLALVSDAAALTHAGQEFSVSCKTYVATLMALEWVGDQLCSVDVTYTRQGLAKASPAVSEYLTRWRSHVECLAEELTGIRHLFLVGRGASLAAAGTGGLIVKESDHFHAEGMSSAAFRHGPFEMISDDVLVLVFSGDRRASSLNMRLVQDILACGGRASVVGEDASSEVFRVPQSPESVRPILEILPVQMITLALAALAGREAGRFEVASKVTASE